MEDKQFTENERFTDIEPNVHKRHHEFVHRLETKEEIKQKMKAQIATSIVTASVWAFITGAAAVVWYAFSQFVSGK